MIFAENKSLDSLYVARSSRRKNQLACLDRSFSLLLLHVHTASTGTQPGPLSNNVLGWLSCLTLPHNMPLHPPFARMLAGPRVGVGGCLEFWFSKTRFCVRFFVWSVCESITKFNSRDMFVMQICVWWDEVSPVLSIHDDALLRDEWRATSIRSATVSGSSSSCSRHFVLYMIFLFLLRLLQSQLNIWICN